MARVLKAKSLQTRKTVALARSLVGKVLVRRLADGTVTRHRLTEVEAYDGERDLACHASKGRTKRTAVMYRPGGHWYVYLCYGVHEMLNLVTGPANYPAAVLIRGVAEIAGPGRLTKRLQINRRLNGAPAGRKSGLWLEDDGFTVPRRSLKSARGSAWTTPGRSGPGSAGVFIWPRTWRARMSREARSC